MSTTARRFATKWGLDMGDVIVLAVIGVCVFFAIRSLRKSAKSGKCCGCSGCSGNCGTCGQMHSENG